MAQLAIKGNPTRGKEKTLQENIDESFNKTNQIIFETQAHCCDIRKSLIDKKQETMEEKDKSKAPILYSEDYANYTFGYKIPNDYEFIDVKNNEIRIRKKKPKYPTTYVECCEILGINELLYLTYTWNLNEDADSVIKFYDDNLCDKINNLRKLLICYHAYCEIASKKMDLNKHWKPDLQAKNQTKYVITNVGGNIAFEIYAEHNAILAFPTKEMRNTFYENFKDLIEAVKELL